LLVTREDDLSDAAVRELLALHLSAMQSNSPPGHAFALDLSGLQPRDVIVWTSWNGAALAGIAALTLLGDGLGEIKSMRTHPDHLRKGVAAGLLEHIIAEARARGLAQLKLETGTGPAFEPALALYRGHGFTEGAPFGGYRASDFNRFFELRL
jgi:putative acetyltransferase